MTTAPPRIAASAAVAAAFRAASSDSVSHVWSYTPSPASWAVPLQHSFGCAVPFGASAIPMYAPFATSSIPLPATVPQSLADSPPWGPVAGSRLTPLAPSAWSFLPNSAPKMPFASLRPEAALQTTQAAVPLRFTFDYRTQQPGGVPLDSATPLSSAARLSPTLPSGQTTSPLQQPLQPFAAPSRRSKWSSTVTRFSKNDEVYLTFASSTLPKHGTKLHGCRAIVLKSPQHPDTWYGLKMLDGQLAGDHVTARKVNLTLEQPEPLPQGDSRARSEKDNKKRQVQSQRGFYSRDCFVDIDSKTLSAISEETSMDLSDDDRQDGGDAKATTALALPMTAAARTKGTNTNSVATPAVAVSALPAIVLPLVPSPHVPPGGTGVVAASAPTEDFMLPERPRSQRIQQKVQDSSQELAATARTLVSLRNACLASRLPAGTWMDLTECDEVDAAV